ncbi:MAG: hypothetical protein ACLQGT_01210 [Terracidiphilus sp.]
MTDATSRRDMLLRAAAIATAATVVPAAVAADQHSTLSNAPATAPSALKAKADKVTLDSSSRMKNLQSKASAAQDNVSKLTKAAAPISPHSEDWKDIQVRAKTLYGADVSTPGGSFPPISYIEETFTFSAKDEDFSFRTQQPEALLNSSADLLERALSSRREWNELQGSAFSVGLSIQQYLELDKIHDDETAAGYYTHTAAETSSLAQADSLAQEDTFEQYNQLGQLIGSYFDQPTIDDQSASAQELAFLSKLADYDSESQNTSPSKYGWNGKTDFAYALAQNAVTVSSYHNLYLEQANLTTLQAATLRGSIVVGAKARASSVKNDWETANVAFRQRRTEVARRMAEKSIASYTEPGGALNYRERMHQVQLIFHRDFRDAMARMQVGAEGIKKIYGYDDPLPKSVLAALTGGPASPIAYDEALIWTRNAIAFLVKFGQVDQGYVHTVSIKNLLGEDEFKKGKKISPWATWTIQVPRDLFPDQYYVRVRGLSLYIVPEGGLLSREHSEGVWMGSVRVPKTSFCEHLNFKTGEVSRMELDQSNIPSSMAGRISYRQNFRPPDVIGTSNLYNNSPFGNWEIKLSPSSSEGVKVDKIDDVVVDLQLAMRMRS